MWPRFVPLEQWWSWEPADIPIAFLQHYQAIIPVFLMYSSVWNWLFLKDARTSYAWCSDTILEPEQEDICSVICRWFVSLFGIGVLSAFPTTVL